MPPPDNLDYNPNIIGFVSDIGPVTISLHTARKRYGELPSEYEMVPKKDGRVEKKGLNLALGKLVTETLKEKKSFLKKRVIDFYDAWHRDYKKEFNVNIRPFENLNDPVHLRHVLVKNRAILADAANLDLRSYLAKYNLIRRDILNSIGDHALPNKSLEIIKRRIKNLRHEEKRVLASESLRTIQAARILDEIRERTGLDVMKIDPSGPIAGEDEILSPVSNDHFKAPSGSIA